MLQFPLQRKQEGVPTGFTSHLDRLTGLPLPSLPLGETMASVLPLASRGHMQGEQPGDNWHFETGLHSPQFVRVNDT